MCVDLAVFVAWLGTWRLFEAVPASWESRYTCLESMKVMGAVLREEELLFMYMLLPSTEMCCDENLLQNCYK